MAKDGENTPYEVGYGKPPVRTRFQKGQSGNPKGRPKGVKNLATLVRDAMRETVVVTEDGERKTHSKMEVAIKQQMNKAAAGDHKAMSLLLPLVQAMEVSDAAASAAEPVTGEAERRVMESITARFRRSALDEMANVPGDTAVEMTKKEVGDGNADA